ncbi:hypothetical protein LOTGIDRAFT_105043 [Lottia gigantea]|uniref:F-BAR domain-containing protein n=1 Tax=Lottia gigantea TaxID=225164 RepID=V4AFU0_LOTGI|nr:hypothetical protein LOTGIDRAFT_105043 [Lottia gigantea]ESO94005.1 hypothetical protein LOTGIDRAFT_105043 [Lottia gigantea]
MGEARKTFNNSFWGEDFTSSHGFDTLLNRLLDGKALCKDMETYLKARSKLELEYSKNLSKLNQSLKFKGVVGQLEYSWDTFREELVQMTKVHEDSGRYFHELDTETRRFIDENSMKRKEISERTKKSHQQKITLYNKTQSLQKTYFQKCKESDTASDTYALLHQGVTTTTKELDKARGNSEKAQENAQKAEDAYKSSVHTLDVARRQWEDDMSLACQAFQTMEEERINYLRDLMWTCSNLDSQMALEKDDSCERVRQMLDTCDITQDIKTFIDGFQTGSSRPLPIPYENFYKKMTPL